MRFVFFFFRFKGEPKRIRRVGLKWLNKQTNKKKNRKKEKKKRLSPIRGFLFCFVLFFWLQSSSGPAFCQRRAETGLSVTYLIRMPALLVTSVQRNAGRRMAAFTILFSRLSYCCLHLCLKKKNPLLSTGSMMLPWFGSPLTPSLPQPVNFPG